MHEIVAYSLVLLPVAGGLVLAILSTRLPVPAPGLFLLAAALAADLWPAVGSTLSVRAVERIAVVALIVILLNGGIDIGAARLRAVAGPVLSLGVLGTFATAGALALAARVLLGFDWTLAGIIGAALAPTDPAVVFSVLGGGGIRGRAGTILEGEAGVNDPAGIALMLGMVEVATHPHSSFVVVVVDFAVAMVVGAVLGLVGVRVLLPSLRHLRLGNDALRPIFVLALATMLYAVTSLLRGSGFLAVFVAGLVLGDAEFPGKQSVERFSSSLAGLAEIVVFVALGLTVRLSALAGEIWRDGIVLTVALAFVVRPAVVWVGVAGAGLNAREKWFLAWAGLKGAVPILLAAFAVLAGVHGAQRVYGLVFVAVLLSVFGQGGLVPLVARRLGVTE